MDDFVVVDAGRSVGCLLRCQRPLGLRRPPPRRYDDRVLLYAFDLLELGGEDLRPQPLQGRKARLEKLLAKAPAGIQYNDHVEGDGQLVFEHACKIGLEGIVCKRRE
jgi:bifunctional non-homologous end joining protein LigD